VTPRRPAVLSGIQVPGFRAAGVHCGLKKAGEPDLALLVSDAPCTAAGVFTTASVVGAPVEVSREHLRGGRARAVVANAGISNVALGARGLRDARAMARHAAGRLGCRGEDVLVASTGVIGEPLPMAKVRAGIAAAAAALAPRGLSDAARAILTTDTRPKLAARRLRVGDAAVHVAGIAKGSGMIEPRMATMLCFVLTDAVVAAGPLRAMLRRTADATLNRLSVDGETSTSDMALVLANGRAGNRPLGGPRGAGARAFETALGEVLEELARGLARDGEGATRLVTVRVEGAASRQEAERAARRIANSLLVKTAIFGADANWGRILQAVAAARVRIALERTRVALAGVPVFRNGAPAGPGARARAQARLRRASEVAVEVHLGAGSAGARMLTCDLGYDYVRINAEYTT